MSPANNNKGQELSHLWRAVLGWLDRRQVGQNVVGWLFATLAFAMVAVPLYAAAVALFEHIASVGLAAALGHLVLWTVLSISMLAGAGVLSLAVVAFLWLASAAALAAMDLVRWVWRWWRRL